MKVGVIAGRFQIFHNGHLRYMREALKQCDHLIIGVTNPDPGYIKQTVEAPHRNTLSANFMTYYERMQMIKAVCSEQNISLDRYDIIPFPIDIPKHIIYYIPKDAIVFITIHDKWSLEKKRRIEEQGYRVKVIIDEFGIEKLSSSMIRDLIVDNKQYEKFIPKSVYKYISTCSLDKKLKQIVNGDYII